MHSLRKTTIAVACVTLVSNILHAQDPFATQNSRASYEQPTQATSTIAPTSRPNSSASAQQAVNRYSTTAAASSTRTPLPPPSEKRKPRDSNSSNSIAPTGTLSTVFGSLAVVLGLFLLVVWLARRALPNTPFNLPKEVVEVLGRTQFGNKQQMQLVRIGNKLLLLCNTASGTDTLTEITDPEEVDRIVGLCQENHPGSISATFRQVLSQTVEEPTEIELAQLDA